MMNHFSRWLVAGVAVLALAQSAVMGQVAAQMPDSVVQIRDVVFGKGGERDLKLHLLRPKKEAKEPMPVVVFIYGGGWRTGNKDQGIRHLLPLAQDGYVCASIEYRHSQEALFPAQIEDCKAAIRFLRSRAKDYNINPDKIAVWGMSAGAHLAALLGTTGDVKELEGKGGSPDVSSAVNAVVDWFGPTDFLKMDAAGSLIPHNPAESPESRLIGGAIQDNPEKVAKANPITYVSKNDPPFLIMHGDKDQMVPINQSELLVAALKKAEVKVTFETVRGAGHGFVGLQHEARVKLFLDEVLKGIKPKEQK